MARLSTEAGERYIERITEITCTALFSLILSGAA
jgi:hypothetical protein